MIIQALAKEEVLRELNTTEQGLTEEESKKRLRGFWGKRGLGAKKNIQVISIHIAPC
jgi:hypothetical protein